MGSDGNVVIKCILAREKRAFGVENNGSDIVLSSAADAGRLAIMIPAELKL